jgi:biotin transporter BioY
VESSRQTWVNRAVIFLVAATVGALLLPWIMGAALLGLALGMRLIVLFGYLMVFGGMPFLAWIVLKPIYRVFFAPYVRAWRINRIRNHRYLQEATSRDT